MALKREGWEKGKGHVKYDDEGQGMASLSLSLSLRHTHSLFPLETSCHKNCEHCHQHPNASAKRAEF